MYHDKFSSRIKELIKNSKSLMPNSVNLYSFGQNCYHEHDLSDLIFVPRGHFSNMFAAARHAHNFVLLAYRYISSGIVM